MKKILPIVFVLLITVFYFYVSLPVLSYGFAGITILLLIIAALLFFSFSKFTISSDGKSYNPVTVFWKLPALLIGVAILYAFVLPFFTSHPIFRNQDYRNLIGKVANGDKLTNHIAPISMNEIRVVDESLAYLLGEKILGSQPALGSQAHLGEFFIQKVNGKLYWIAPLEHSGFFKWLNNKQGTTGYVMVSATNERDVKLVQEVNGKPIFLKYQREAYFGSNLHRYLYFNGFNTVGLTDFSFEIDDAGTPYWVVTKYKKQVGFSGNDATGVVVVNAQSGEIKEYNIKNTPTWVDRIQPISFIKNQLNDWGEYVKGYWNFSHENKLQITEDLTLVYGEDNKSYWYTGITSVGKDESAVGFVLVDTRTKETTFYKQSGATEYAAQSSAQGKVQEKGFVASLPIPYNINNIPTYVMTLKDKGGLVKMYAMVSIADYTIVGTGNTMREALTAYKTAFNSSGNKINPDSKSAKKVIESVVVRIQNDVKNGNSFYYFTVKDYPSIFVGSSQISNQLPITSVGDNVKISFDLDNEEIIDVSTFENVSLKK
ncbi:hypothetical protein G6N05_05800 [Flavobacterium sp. F372]|uniref:Cell shape-determining protein n=1 Tax=Flavobacterium bernardetii TaxID=2813823 RepID=A0ABR7IZY4_9FLAO|nr:hypothetical protein [Flavobacterium bernardetii]MBC5835278.1 hypothetical protein [Flavobacterium bernardetii]NHF69623.1 hypothetical protein [Flavobacterium bernardetii]